MKKIKGGIERPCVRLKGRDTSDQWGFKTTTSWKTLNVFRQVWTGFKQLVYHWIFFFYFHHKMKQMTGSPFSRSTWRTSRLNSELLMPKNTEYLRWSREALISEEGTFFSGAGMNYPHSRGSVRGCSHERQAPPCVWQMNSKQAAQQQEDCSSVSVVYGCAGNTVSAD